MAKLFGTHFSKEDVFRYFGSLDAVAGLRRLHYDEGLASGLRVVEVRNGSGLRFLVQLDRALDIGLAEYMGMPVGYRSIVGEVGPQFYESQDDGWLRSYGGGLLATCGLSNIGAASSDAGEQLGTHGRIGNTPADQVSLDTVWNGDQCDLFVRGRVVEAKALGTRLALYREISVRVGENRIRIRDTVVNEGFKPAPLMILYHVNVGHPILDAGTRLIVNAMETSPRDDTAAREMDSFDSYAGPTADYPDTVFYHRLKSDDEGMARAMLANETIGRGVFVHYGVESLPYFLQWKYSGEGDYAAGLEPANAFVGGRSEEREGGRLQILEPNEARDFRVDVGLVTSREDLIIMEKSIGQTQPA